MEYLVLGPLEARAAGRRLDLGGPRQRRLLAALVLRRNRTVPLTDLASAVWDGDPPPTAHRQVRNAVGVLRGLLTRHGGFIDSDEAGYRLRTGPGELDLDVFDELVAQGRATGDPVLLRRALAHWRGPALAGLGGGTLARAAAALEEKRLTVLEDWAELEAATGHDLPLVPELQAAVAANPLRERLVERLVVALHRAGRPAAATAAYRELAGRLADELGIDPSPRLRRVYEGLGGGAGPGTAAAGVPRQLPADVSGFTGRSAELTRLDAALAGTAVAMSAIAGTPGVGKTALAVHWAHQVRAAFPDGQLYVNLRGYAPTPPVNPLDALGGFLRALGVPPERVPTDLAAATELYRTSLAGRRVLVVLDNAAGLDQVRPLLPTGPGNFAVVTSRNTVEDLPTTVTRMTLDILGPDEAVDLLGQVLGTARVVAEPDAAAALARLCGYLPLALRIAAANAADTGSLAGYVDRFRAGSPLAALAVDGDERAAVRAAFDLSYAAQPAPAQRLFRLLGLVPGPDFGASAAASLLAVTTDEAGALLDRPADAHLLDRTRPGRYSAHDLIRAYAAELAATVDREADRTAAAQRLLDHYLHSAYAANRALDPHRIPIPLDPPAAGVVVDTVTDATAALHRFQLERATLLAAVDWAAATGFDRHAWQLAWSTSTYLHRQGFKRDWIASHEAALGSAQRLGDELGQARIHNDLALALIGQPGRADDVAAHLDRALDLRARLGDDTGQAHVHMVSAALYEPQGRYREALDHARRAHDLYRRGGHRAGEALTLNGIGWYHALLGEYPTALAYCEQALELQRDLGDPAMEANTWDSLCYVHQHLGNHADAVRCAQRALDLYRKVGERFGEGDALTHLGDAHRAGGDPAAARAAWEQALAVLEELDHPHAADVRARLRG